MFKIKEKSNIKKPVGKKFEIIQHSNGQVGLIIGKLNLQQEVKVAIFDENCSTSYGCWKLENCSLFQGEIILSNE